MPSDKKRKRGSKKPEKKGIEDSQLIEDFFSSENLRIVSEFLESGKISEEEKKELTLTLTPDSPASPFSPFGPAS